nr:hypothetical protein [Tanacetum cinerariifolium]
DAAPPVYSPPPSEFRSIIILTHDKMAYHIINDRKPSIKHLYIFGCIYYLTRDGEHLDKMKEKGNLCILVGYSTQSKGYRVYNKRTKLIVESIHIRFDEIKERSETYDANDTSGLVPQRQKASDYDNSDPIPQLQNVSSSADAHVPLQQEQDILFGPLYDEFFTAARNANPLALVATAQANQDPYYQTSKSHKSHAPSSKSHTTTRYKGKEIKNLALIAKYFKKIYKPTNNNLGTSSNSRNKNVDTTLQYKNNNQSGQFRNQRMVNVAGARENVGSPVVQQYGIQCFNCKEFRHFAKECRKPKRVKDFSYHKEKMLLCKQAEKGVPLQDEQYDWLSDTDEEIDEQELKAHYSNMAKIQKVPTADTGTDSEPLEHVQNVTGYNVFANDLQHSEQSESVSNTCVVETDDSNVFPDSPYMCDDDIQNDQNDVESDDERVALANLKLELQHSEQSESVSNTSVVETDDSNVFPDSPYMCDDDIQNDQNDVESDDERVALANLKLDVDENKKIQNQLKKANTTLT